MDAASGGRRRVAGVLAIVGGVLLAAGSFLTWAEVSGGGTTARASGTDGSDGWVTLAAGAALLATGAAFVGGRGRRGLGVIAIVAALIGGGTGLYDALTARDRVLDALAEALAEQVAATAQEVRAILDVSAEAGELAISIRLGLFMVIGGGALGLVGGWLGLGGRRPAPDAPPPLLE